MFRHNGLLFDQSTCCKKKIKKILKNLNTILFVAHNIFASLQHTKSAELEGRNTKMANNNRSSNQLVVPQATQALNQMKMEAAQELSIQFSADGYNGNLSTRDAGSIGGYITRKLVQMAEQQLSGNMR